MSLDNWQQATAFLMCCLLVGVYFGWFIVFLVSVCKALRKRT